MRNWLRWRLRKLLDLDTADEFCGKTAGRHERELKELTMRMSHLELILRDIEAGLKPPFSQRLAQLREANKLITNFANELQRDIENVQTTKR